MKPIVPTAAALSVLILFGGAGRAGVPRSVETIRYQTGPCFGFCPAYVVTVSSDGRGVFEPSGHTAAPRRQAFTISSAQFAAFRARLKPVRPNGAVLIEPGTPLCAQAATDQISVDVRWSGGKGDPRHLSYYFGCDMDRHADLRRVLTGAPAALPISALVGPPRHHN